MVESYSGRLASVSLGNQFAVEMVLGRILFIMRREGLIKEDDVLREPELHRDSRYVEMSPEERQDLIAGAKGTLERIGIYRDLHS